MICAVTSDFPTTNCEPVLDLIHSLGSRLGIAWIPPSSKDGQERFPAARERFTYLGLPSIEHLDIEHPSEGLPSQLAEFEVIYLSGGNPIRFRENLRKSGLADIWRATPPDKLIIGASGGSMQLSPNVSLFRLMSTGLDEVQSERNSYDGLGFLQFEILPHFNRSEDDFLELVRKYSETLTHDIIALSDGAAIIDKDGDRATVGTSALFRQGERYN